MKVLGADGGSPWKDKTLIYTQYGSPVELLARITDTTVRVRYVNRAPGSKFEDTLRVADLRAHEGDAEIADALHALDTARKS